MPCCGCGSLRVAILPIAILVAFAAFIAQHVAPKQADPLPTAAELRDWHRPPERSAGEPVSKIVDLAYLVLSRRPGEPLAATKTFLRDFGLEELAGWGGGAETSSAHHYFRCKSGLALPCLQIRESVSPTGSGGGGGLVGFGFYLHDEAAMDRLAALPESISSESELPIDAGDRGGGRRVTLRDPDGLTIEVRSPAAIAVAAAAPRPLRRGPRKMNSIAHRAARPANKPIRPTPYGPPDVWRLAHCVMYPRNILRSLRWYQETLGLIVSDFQFLPTARDELVGRAPAVAFMRADRGPDTPTDHHTLALASIPKRPGSLEHCAFDVQDWDAVGEGQRFLQMKAASSSKSRRNYRHAWGMGRHLLGSNVFDYWREPGAGQMFEHTTDTDQLDSSYPTGYWLLTETAQASTGPVPGPEFIEPLTTLVHAVRRFFQFGSTGAKQVAQEASDNNHGTDDDDDDYGGLQGFRRALALGQAMHPSMQHMEHESFRRTNL